MANTIMTEQTLSFSAVPEVEEMYVHMSETILLPLTIGESYKVVWDGKEYNCVAEDGGDGLVALGNISVIMGEGDTGEPFLFGSDGVSASIFYALNDAAETHTVAVYESKTNAIVLYDRTGAAVVYEDVETLTTDTPVEGERVTFTRGVLMDGAEIVLNMATGDQEVAVPNGYLIKKAILKKPETLLPEYIKRNIEIAGVIGEFAGDEMEKIVDLAMVAGDQVIEADKDTVLTKVIVKKPGTLVPENIIDGVEIGGIVGTFVAPKLFALNNAYKTKSNNLVNIYVYRYNQNGTFALRFQLVNRDTGEILTEKNAGDSTSYTSNIFGHEIQERPSVQPFHISARLVGDGFAPSEPIDIPDDIVLTDITYFLEGCTHDFEYERLFAGSSVAMVLTPNEGLYIAKKVEVSDGNGEIEYVYDNFTGNLSFEVPQVEDITIRAIAPDVPWLHEPELEIDSTNYMATVMYIDENTENTYVMRDGEMLFMADDEREGLIAYEITEKAESASYGFVEESDGFYKNGNTSTYSASLCRVDFDMKTESEIVISYVNNGYSNLHYGVISKVDHTLSNSYSSDVETSHSNVYTNFKGLNSASVYTVKMTIPAGKHFIYIKFRRTSSSATGYYFKFKISTEVAERTKYSLIEELGEYGEHLLQVQSVADGYTSSDVVDIHVNIAPVIKIKDAVLNVSSLIDAETVSVIADGERIGTVECAGLEEIEIDLGQYNLSIAEHSIYVVVTDNEGKEWESNVVNDEICFAYKTFAEADFAEIDAIAKAGYAATLYSVGDTKEVVFGDTTKTLRIIDFDKDELADGSGKAQITFCVYPLDYSTNLATSQYQSWTGIKPREYLMNTFPATVPEELQNILKPVIKKYYYMNANGTKLTGSCTDTWFMPSAWEIGNTSYDEKSGIVYEGLKTTNDRIMKTAGGTAEEWWLRTLNGSASMYVSTAGALQSLTVTTSYTGYYHYVLPCACI